MRDLIEAEMQQADRLKQKHLDGFVRDGVDLVDLTRSRIRLDRVMFDGDRFEFSRHNRTEQGVSAFVWPCLDVYGYVSDIAAWRPPQLALWLGNVAMLGEELTNGPRLCEPLSVFPTVLRWFQARREGVFIMNYPLAACLLRTETLGAEDAAHARVLKSRLTIPAPPITIVERHMMEMAA